LAKLWNKDYDVESLIEEFTVGQDYVLDRELVPADCLGSMAQGKVLAKIGILTQEEENKIHSVLCSIIQEHGEGKFTIDRSDEDCHTAIENRLVRDIGEAGKKIHTGRSRNDQVLTALRLYGRERTLEILDAGLRLVETLLDAAERYASLPMPGRTHMQFAMPSSVGLWAASWTENLLDDLDILKTAYDLCNRCPLGSAASYGTPLPLDRELAADLLGFSEVHNNVLAANNSRGKLDSVVLDALDQTGITLSKIAQDLILFSLPEFAYFSLPRELCTGSSIMPQKKNPDGLELTRAKAASLGAWALQIKSVIRSLPSGYNRDYQETKEPFLRGLKTSLILLRVMDLMISKLEVHPEAMKKAFSPDIYAADAAYEKVLQGMTFRDAYREVGLHLDELEHRDPGETLKNRTSTGTAGNLRLDIPRGRGKKLTSFIEAERARISSRLNALAGFPVQLVIP
jgi:argininosuccinate lyase